MSKTEIKLPDEIIKVGSPNVRDLVMISIPKMGKSAILGDFTKTHNAIVLDLEKGGYEYIEARKISTNPTQETTIWENFQNYIEIRNALLKAKGKYQYLIIDGLSDLDIFSEIGGTLVYMDSIIGKKFNREGGNILGRKYTPNDSEFRMVTTLPDGAGYLHTRKWFLDQVEIFKQISPYRIYAAHVTDKYIKDNGKDEVIGSEISLTGRLKTIFASKVTSLAKLTADGNKRYLNFEVMNDSIIAGSRAPYLKDKILISERQDDGSIKTFWDRIYLK